MVTRQEQFELDRKKMLSSIGQEPDEPKIEVEPKKRVKEQSEIDFEEKLEYLKADKPSVLEYEARACQAFEEKCEADEAIRNLPEEKRERAEKLRHNKHVRTRQRTEHRGYSDGFGAVIELMDDFQATFGGGVVYKFYGILVATPVACFWYATENWLCFLIAGFFMLFVGRLMCAWISLVARGLMHIVTAMGPRYICDIREGTPAIKLIVSLLNKCLWVATYAHVVAFGGLFTLLAINTNWTRLNWINSYCLILGVSFAFASITWFSNALIGFGIYSSIISGLLSGSSPVKYRIRYLHDSGRVMIPTRKCDGPFVSKAERLKAFTRDYCGIA